MMERYWMLTLLAMIAGLAGRIEGFYAVVAISAVQYDRPGHLARAMAPMPGTCRFRRCVDRVRRAVHRRRR